MRYLFHLWPQDRWPSLADVTRVCTEAERLGYSGVISGEHILVPDGPETDVVGRRYYDPFVLFATIAAHTTTLRLHYSALVVPYRHPAQTARALASLDEAADGRLTVVVGSGWSASEFDLLGIPFERRGALTDEYVDVMRRLWTQDGVAHAGESVSFGPSTLEPKCVQTPHVPLWIGGSGPVARRRVVQYGAGWAPIVGTLEQLREEIARMREAVADAGRDPSALGFSYHINYLEVDPYYDDASAEVAGADTVDLLARDAQQAIETVGHCAQAGVTHLHVRTRWETPDQLIESLQRFAEEVMPHTA
jgi:probable F420-dependent oxidoreductase